MAQEKQVYYLNVAEAFKDETGGPARQRHPRWASFWDRELYQMVRLSENTYSNGGITAMKKLLTITMAALLAAALLLTGCGKSEKTDIDMEATMKAMMDATEVEDEMKKMEGEVVGNFYNIDDSAVDSYLIYSSAPAPPQRNSPSLRQRMPKGWRPLKPCWINGWKT